MGAKTVAVATGKFSVAELEGHGANVVFGDLADVDAVLAELNG